MKKSVLISSLLMVSMTVFGQSTTFQSFEKGKFSVSLGYGLAHIGQMFRIDQDDDLFTPTTVTRYQAAPFALQMEYAVANRWSVGLSTYSENYEVDRNFVPLFGADRIYQQNKIQMLSFVARGSFHFGKKESRFDPYLSGGLGIAHLFYGTDNVFFINENNLTIDLKLGGRYFFSKNLGVHLEAGLGSILVQTGLTGKF
jgi:outer membrane protein W